MYSRPQILVIGPFDFALRERILALAQAGFEISHADVGSAKKSVKQYRGDIILLAHSINGVARKSLLEWIREQHRSAFLLCLYARRKKVVRNADAAISIQSPAEETAETARTLLGLPIERHLPQLLLLITTNEAVGQRLGAVLAAGKYSVLRASTQDDIDGACKHAIFNLVVIGPDLGPHFKCQIVSLLRQIKNPAAVLELGRETPDIPGAYCLPLYSDQELLFAVRACLGKSMEMVRTGAHWRLAIENEK